MENPLLNGGDSFFSLGIENFEEGFGGITTLRNNG